MTRSSSLAHTQCGRPRRAHRCQAQQLGPCATKTVVCQSQTNAHAHTWSPATSGTPESSSAWRVGMSLLLALTLLVSPLLSCSATPTPAESSAQNTGGTKSAIVSRSTDHLLKGRTAESSSSLVPRSAQYANDVSVRWKHTSVIADQTLYIFGGKNGTTNKKEDYVSQCLMLDLSKKFTTNSPPWSTSCSNSAPLIAGHSAIINSNINMIIAFGGTVPDDTQYTTPLRLYSTGISFWNNSPESETPKPLVNHTAVLQEWTGDMIVFGGVHLNTTHAKHDTLQISNSTFRMVTDRDSHVVVTAPPLTPFKDMYSASSSSAPWASASASASASPPRTATKSDDINEEVSEILKQLTATSTTQSSKPTSRTRSSTQSQGLGRRDSLVATASSKRGPASKYDSANGQYGGSNSAVRSLQKRAADKPGIGIMKWINSALPEGVSGRVGHTASMVNDSKMVILGGSDGESLAAMSDIYLYNMLSRAWVRRKATGNIPVARRDHVAAVVDGDLIVIHGGTDANYNQALDDIAVLDTTTWTWTAPSVANLPAGRYAHSATMAGPYMLLTFGYTLPNPESIDSGDSGLYILDTDSWQFVTQFDPLKANLIVASANRKISPGTIFGLAIASLVGFIVLWILAFIAYIHYYNKHPEFLDDGEGGPMLPTTELRNLGRKLTVKLGVQNRRRRHELNRASSSRNNSNHSSNSRQSAQPGPSLSLTNMPMPAFSDESGAGDDASLRIMFDLSRGPSLDLQQQQQQHAESGDGGTGASYTSSGMRYSRRTHLDDVELPAGLRNRDDDTGLAGKVDGNASVPHSSLHGSIATDKDSGQWSHSGTSDYAGYDSSSNASRKGKRKSKHVSAMLPRVIGSRLTLPAESASALARYRFEELEDSDDGSYQPPVLPPINDYARPSGGKQPSIAMLAKESGRDGGLSEALAPPIMPAAQYEAPMYRQRASDGSNARDSDRTDAGPAASKSSKAGVRDSIDVNAVFSRMNNNHFYVANPDN